MYQRTLKCSHPVCWGDKHVHCAGLYSAGGRIWWLCTLPTELQPSLPPFLLFFKFYFINYICLLERQGEGGMPCHMHGGQRTSFLWLARYPMLSWEKYKQRIKTIKHDPQFKQPPYAERLWVARHTQTSTCTPSASHSSLLVFQDGLECPLILQCSESSPRLRYSGAYKDLCPLNIYHVIA